MDIKNLTDKIDNVFFDRTNAPNSKVKFGHTIFQPGERIPKQGYGKHEQDEYSYIIKGAAYCDIGGKTLTAQAGMAMFIPANEEHYTYNNQEEEFEVIWVLAEPDEE